MDIELKDIEKYMAFILKTADEKAADAGYSGRMDDGGAQHLRDEVAFYRMGRSGTVPTSWYKYIKEYAKENDPEYAKYLELKKKFE